VRLGKKSIYLMVNILLRLVITLPLPTTTIERLFSTVKLTTTRTRRCYIILPYVLWLNLYMFMFNYTCGCLILPDTQRLGPMRPWWRPDVSAPPLSGSWLRPCTSCNESDLGWDV
jgi:hypothetical protein